MSIISSIRNYLHQPQAESFGGKEAFRTGFFISLAVAFVVYLVNIRNAPFGELEKVLYSLLFGLITLVIATANDLVLPKLFPVWFEEKGWTIGKSLLWISWNFLSIAFANMFFMIQMGWMSSSLPNFVEILFTTFLVGIIPIVIVKLWDHNRLLQTRLKEASQINQGLHERQVIPPPVDEQISVISNQKTVLVPVNQIIFATSERNYVRFELDNGEQLLVRSTIKRIEELLAPYNYVLRCHRAFIVNTKKVNTVDGNAQGLRLHLEGYSEYVPVSRSYIPSVRGAF